MDAQTFGYWLHHRRKALDWTQAELAQRVHCTAATIRKIEADERKPSRQLAEALAEQLKISIDQRTAFLQAARRTTLSGEVTFGTDTPTATPSPHNLPAPLTSLIDRVNDIAAIAAMLTRDDVRLLTLIGPPGIGKTRLCIQSAENVLAHFPDGVWFVDLAPLAQPQFVLPTIARALNIAESGAMSPSQQLVTTFKDKRVLLALDNFEQVVDAARDVSELLKSCKGLKVLVTSRVPLHVYGEHEYSVPGMSLPPRDTAPNKLIDYEAVQLFIARAPNPPVGSVLLRWSVRFRFHLRRIGLAQGRMAQLHLVLAGKRPIPNRRLQNSSQAGHRSRDKWTRSLQDTPGQLRG